MTWNLMILGTASGAGKTTVAAGLSRIFYQDGYQTAPFKAQNMTNNVHLLPGGLELARSQVICACAAGMEPQVHINPILLKFRQDRMEAVIRGISAGCMDSAQYRERSLELWDVILDSYNRLAEKAEIIVLEGAGSPVEMNLKPHDMANLSLAKRVGAPALLVADIDRGGAFAAICGTLQLLDEEERCHIKGIIINKLRGAPAGFSSLKAKLQEIAMLPVVGMLPYTDIAIEDEDSLADPASGVKMRQSDEAMEAELDRLADHVRRHLDIQQIYKIMQEGMK